MTDFYSDLIDNYDEMTRFSTRLPKLRETLKRTLSDNMPRTALDVACGTGVGAIALAQLGVDVIGTDPNADMIAKARMNAATLALTRVRFQTVAMQDNVPGLDPVEMVTCFGNSIPHVPRQELPAVAKRFRSYLKDGGKAIIQLKNFERILADGNRFVGADRNGEDTLVRFYDLGEGTVTFNVLRLNWDGERATQNWIQTELTAFTCDELKTTFLNAGFTSVTCHSSLDQKPFDAASSPDLVISAKV